MDTLTTWLEAHQDALQDLAQQQGMTAPQLHQRLRQALQPTPAPVSAPVEEPSDHLHLLHSLMHELRSPLVTLRGYVDMMAQGKLGPTTPLQEKSMRTAQRNAAALEDQIETALHFARLQRQQLHVQKRDISLDRLLQRSLRFFDTQAERKRISLQLQAPQENPSLHIDPAHIERVLRLLLDNAIKFTDQGEVTLCAQVLEGKLRLGVRDSGRGIPADQLEAIFEPFTQVRDNDKGAGLGLTVARGLLEAHGCTLHLETQPGQGSYFWFDLPL
jgi:signal transduction histidine kinase